MTTVYVLLAECGTSGGVTADAYHSWGAANSAAVKLLASDYPCSCRIVRVDQDGTTNVSNIASPTGTAVNRNAKTTR